MKKLILINITLLIWSTNVFAEMLYVGNDTINAIDTDNIFAADILKKSSNESVCVAASCDFYQTFTTNYFTDDALRATGIVTSDYRTSVKSDESDAYLDLTFSSNVVNGTGNDLILFFVGNMSSFGLDVFDNTGNSINNSDYTIATPTYDGTTTTDYGDTVRDAFGESILLDNFPLSAILIDFGESYEGTTIDTLHLTLKDSNFALAGGFHTQATVVPLPMSIILFGSGLSLLGWLGRKKSV